jgi:hypothetical protein
MGGTQNKKKLLHERLNPRFERVNIDRIDEVIISLIQLDV